MLLLIVPFNRINKLVLILNSRCLKQDIVRNWYPGFTKLKELSKLHLFLGRRIEPFFNGAPILPGRFIIKLACRFFTVQDLFDLAWREVVLDYSNDDISKLFLFTVEIIKEPLQSSQASALAEHGENARFFVDR